MILGATRRIEPNRCGCEAPPIVRGDLYKCRARRDGGRSCMSHRRASLKWVQRLGASAVLLSCATVAQADGPGADLPRSSASTLPGPPAARSEPPQTSVDDLAKRLRAMEETNRKLAEQLERTTREHDQQMRMLLEKYGELSRRLNESGAADAPGGGPVVAPTEPIGDPPGAEVETPVPDYRDGSEIPPAPGAADPRSGKVQSGRSPLIADFGPGFRLETDDDEYQLQVDSSRRSRPAPGRRVTRTPRTAASSCHASGSSSGETSPGPSSTNSRSTAG